MQGLSDLEIQRLLHMHIGKMLMHLYILRTVGDNYLTREKREEFQQELTVIELLLRTLCED